MKIQVVTYNQPKINERSNISPSFLGVSKPSVDTFERTATTAKKTLKNLILSSPLITSLGLAKIGSKPTKSEKIQEQQPLTLQQKIESGNSNVNLQAFKLLDINNSIYNNTKKAAVYIAEKISRQAGVITASDIEKSASNLSDKYNIPKQEVINIMGKITQFGSYRQLQKMCNKLSQYDITSFYSQDDVTVNTALKYINEAKKQLSFEYNPKFVRAYILDDSSIQVLESMSQNALNNFKSLLDSRKLALITLDGCGIKAGDNCYSYTALSGDLNLEGLTEAVIKQKLNGVSEEEIYNQEYRNRIKNLLGEKYSNKIKNISIYNPNNTPSSVAEQIKPNIPDAKVIEKVVDVYMQEHGFKKSSSEEVKNLLYNYFDSMVKLNCSNDEIKSLLYKYLASMVKVYSPDTLSRVLRQRHKEITDRVKQMGKSMDNVFYIIPEDNKSYDLINYMYSQVNHVSPNKFVRHIADVPQKSIVVVIDDVVGSGDSMSGDSFDYYLFKKKNESSNVIFSPIHVCSIGLKAINDTISSFKRVQKDVVLSDKYNYSNYKEFKNKLDENEKNTLYSAIGFLGHISNGLCIAFPYMIPDNCSTFASYLLDFCLNCNNDRANRAHPNKEVLGKIRKQINN